MNNGDTVERDKHGFEVGTMRAQIAALIDQGLDNQAIIARKFLKQNVYSTRNAIKAKLDPKPKKERGAYKTKNVEAADTAVTAVGGFDQWGFRIKTQRHQVALALLKNEDVFAVAKQFDVNKNVVYTVRRKMQAAQANGGVALVEHKPKAAVKTNGHAPASPIDVPMIECIVHDGQGNETPIFSSPDVFPKIYAHVLRRLRLGNG